MSLSAVHFRAASLNLAIRWKRRAEAAEGLTAYADAIVHVWPDAPTIDRAHADILDNAATFRGRDACGLRVSGFGQGACTLKEGHPPPCRP